VPSEPARFSDELERWQAADGDKTLGSLIATFDEKSFAVLFVVLMGVPALPLPTGGATHVLEVIVMLLALQLIAGRREVWLPRRWQELKLTGERWQRFIARLATLVRRLERLARMRASFVFGRRPANALFGVLVLVGAAVAFVAPPFSGLDTLPALGVVLVSAGVVLEDLFVVVLGLVVEAAGVILVFVLGRAAFEGIRDLAALISAAVPL
jgi:hypothetical protein